MRNTVLIELGGVGFFAVEPQDARIIRRGGVVVWVSRRGLGWRALSVQAAPMISLLAGLGPPDADCLLVSPPIADGRRLRGVLAQVERAVWASELDRHAA